MSSSILGAACQAWQLLQWRLNKVGLASTAVPYPLPRRGKLLLSHGGLEERWGWHGNGELEGWKLTYELGHGEAHLLHIPLTVEHVVALHRRWLHLHLQVGLTLNCGGP